MKRYDSKGHRSEQGDWVFYGDAQAVIDGLQALLNERDAEIDRLRVREIGDWSWANVEAPILETLAREAATDHIGQHSYLESAGSCEWQPHRWVLAAMTRAVHFAARRSPEADRCTLLALIGDLTSMDVPRTAAAIERAKALLK